MLDRQFEQTLDRKLSAFRTMILATATLKGDDDSHFELIQSAYESLGRFLKEAMGKDSDPKPDDQDDQGTEKNDRGQDASAWSTIRRVRHSGLNLNGKTIKSNDSAWDSIERVVPQNLDLGSDDQTVKSENGEQSAWGTIRRARNVSGIEV